MQSNRSRDTRPELALRKLLWAAGLRYRVAARPIPNVRRTVDILFRPSRVAVEIRGCFWHGCPQHHRTPQNNRDYWVAKIARNRTRDEATESLLRDAGWLLIIVWEHDNVHDAAARITRAVSERRAAPRMRAS